MSKNWLHCWETRRYARRHRQRCFLLLNDYIYPNRWQNSGMTCASGNDAVLFFDAKSKTTNYSLCFQQNIWSEERDNGKVLQATPIYDKSIRREKKTPLGLSNFHSRASLNKNHPDSCGMDRGDFLDALGGALHSGLRNRTSASGMLRITVRSRRTRKS